MTSSRRGNPIWRYCARDGLEHVRSQQPGQQATGNRRGTNNRIRGLTIIGVGDREAGIRSTLRSKFRL